MAKAIIKLQSDNETLEKFVVRRQLQNLSKRISCNNAIPIDNTRKDLRCWNQRSCYS